MATIEPRLIHLLNESTTPQLSHADLPPLHARPLPSSTELPLPPLEPDAAHRTDKNADGHAPGTTTSLPLRGTDDGATNYKRDEAVRTATGVHPLRSLLGDSDAPESSNSLSKILDDANDSWDDAQNKKRVRGLTVKDEFLQLPQPVKKQKAAMKAPVMPPIIIGLHEPPPHAALFPPISSQNFSETDANQLKLLQEFNHASDVKVSKDGCADTDKNGQRSRKKAAKPRKKWSEEETNHLLLGVNKHGVGKWTSILEDPNFKFNGRTAGDLKDRFRTCCPSELRAAKDKSGNQEPPSPSHKETKSKPKKGIHFENILINDDDGQQPQLTFASGPQDDCEPKQHKKSRAHRKKMEDLVELGIHGPFKKSHRRERCPFTDQDDKEILKGLELYGPAWTKIQRDPRFHLSSRQPTDLRDRVRNKYNTIYQKMEKTSMTSKEGGRGNDVMEPSVVMSIENSLGRPGGSTIEPSINRTNSKEDPPRWPLQPADPLDTSQSSQGFEFGESTTSHFMAGEMDISRLLLDDAKIS